MSRGAYVALLGLDGSGKTTIARGLIGRLEEHGLKPSLVRWRDIADEPDRMDFPRPSLRQFWMETARTRYGGGTDAPSLRVQHGPTVYDEFKRGGFDRGPAYPVGVRRSGVVASAMLEVIADMLIHTEVINEQVADGDIVLTESFGYKDIVKVLRVAAEIPGEDVPEAFVTRMIEFVADAYASDFLQPDIGIFLKVGPEECYRRITAQREGVGPTEDLGFAGRTGRSSFMDLQGPLFAEYERLAVQWGWHVVDIDGASPEEALDAVADIVLADVTSAQDTAELM
jgi:thymidylate kinase